MLCLFRTLPAAFAFLVLADVAFAAGEQTGTAGRWDWLANLAGSATILGAAGWVATKAYEAVSGRIAAQKKFAEGVTADVVKLAGTHYWALANLAGTVGNLLDDHLRSVQAHLALRYTAPDDLRRTIRKVSDETANSSFPSVVRLIVLFDRFQFRGSQTYLLPDHAAGPALRRLYNQFTESLPAGSQPEAGFVTKVRQAVEKHLRDEGKWQSGEVGLGLDGTFLETRETIAALGLEPVQDRYRDWLEENLLQVSDAADAMLAFAQVLTHELALLHRDFFRDRQWLDDAPSYGRRVLTEGGWPGTLTKDRLITLVQAEGQSEFYRPLGGIAAAAAAPAPPPAPSLKAWSESFEERQSAAPPTVQAPPGASEALGGTAPSGAREAIGS